MTVPYEIPIFHDVTAEADGTIDIVSQGGYHGEDVSRMFTADEMRKIAAHAEAHHKAYQAYIDRGYEGEDVYFEAMEGFTSD